MSLNHMYFIPVAAQYKVTDNYTKNENENIAKLVEFLEQITKNLPVKLSGKWKTQNIQQILVWYGRYFAIRKHWGWGAMGKRFNE